MDTPERPGTSPETSDGQRWRLHRRASVRALAHDHLVLACHGRRWRIRGATPRTSDWLLGVGHWPREHPLPTGAAAEQTAALADWLVAEGLVTRLDLEKTTVVSRGPSQLRPGLRGRLPVAFSALPQADDLPLHAGLVVLEQGAPDLVSALLLHHNGIPHVVVELTAEGCSVGTFLDGTACTRCDDLRRGGNRPLLAERLVRPPQRERVPTWMTDWAASQVVLAVRRWRTGSDLQPGWWRLDLAGNVGHEQVPAHPSCCGQSAGAARVAA